MSAANVDGAFNFASEIIVEHVADGVIHFASGFMHEVCGASDGITVEAGDHGQIVFIVADHEQLIALPIHQLDQTLDAEFLIDGADIDVEENSVLIAAKLGHCAFDDLLSVACLLRRLEFNSELNHVVSLDHISPSDGRRNFRRYII